MAHPPQYINQSSDPTGVSRASVGDDPTKETTDKVNGFVIFGQFLIIGMAVSVTGALGVAVYGLAFKVSVVKPIGTLLVIAVVSGFFGEIFIAHGKSWPSIDPPPYQQYFQGVATNIRSYMSIPLIQNQKPGLVNQGNTCFINGPLQALFALPPYRAALLETAQREHEYYTAWLKLYRAITTEQDAGFTEWSDEEIKGALICLARKPDVLLEADEIIQLEQKIAEELEQKKTSEVEKNEAAAQHEAQERIDNKKICFSNCVISGGLVATQFSQSLEEFKTAHVKGEKWPNVPSDLSASFIEAIHFFRVDPLSRKYFEKLRTHHETNQKKFDVLQKTIVNYKAREALLAGDVTQLTSQQIETPKDLPLNQLRDFLPLGNSYVRRQEDAEEFILQLLGCIRACEYPGLFAFSKIITHLEEFTTEDVEIKTRVLQERLKKEREEHLPKNRQSIPPNPLQKPLIQVTFPTGENKTGQEALNDSMNCLQPEKDRAKNLMFYIEGDYYNAREELVLENFPDYLIASLGRFAYNKEGKAREKINTALPFTDTLIVQGQKYRIVAITTHHGSSAENGHYTALVWDKGQWWQCNDDIVSKATPGNIETGFNLGYIYCLKKVVSATENA